MDRAVLAEDRSNDDLRLVAPLTEVLGKTVLRISDLLVDKFDLARVVYAVRLLAGATVKRWCRGAARTGR